MITLEISPSSGFTVLSNQFIDQYLPAANGEFVKVYIYLLRSLSDHRSPLTLELLADRLQNTERDIKRALTYWEKQKLLTLSYDEKKQLTGIRLHAIPESLPDSSDVGEPTGPSPQGRGKALAARPREDLSPARIRELKKNEEVTSLLYMAEKYLGKTLTPTETKKLLFLYDCLGMSYDLIEYLIEYCVLHNHKSIRYIETVAFAWDQDGIQTVEQAKAASSQYKKEYYTILKAMGVTGRSPVPEEAAYIDTWLNTYGFSMDIIQEACSRTVLKTGQSSFPYADRILSDWKSSGVHALADIQALDTAHQKKKSAKEPAIRSSRAGQNRFNNFQQRTYDFAEYEKRLLNQ